MEIMPWGLTSSQTLLLVLAALAVLVVLFILRFVLNLGMALLRLGCIALVILAAIAFVISFLNRVGTLNPR